ncbi:MAG TPA: hypothetical protein VGQ57_08760 [Polyangiaceae bacterium]|jgi:hypothetical protein|nr:hypothetical protein [Polyangiaceae bacterium]
MTAATTTPRVGRFRVQPTAELHAFIERTFVETAPEAQRDAVRSEAFAELAGAELVLEAPGTLISRSNGQEFLRVTLPPGALDTASFSFEKRPGLTVTVQWIDAETLEAREPGKPVLVFRRS